MTQRHGKTLWWMLTVGVALFAACLVWGLQDATGRALAMSTARLVLATLALSLPIGVPVAVLLFRTDLPGRRTLLFLLGLLLLVPLYLQSAGWMAGFGPNGWYRYSTWFSSASEGTKLLLLERLRGAVWVHACAAVPWIVGIVGVGLLRVEGELEERAGLDGSAVRVFFSVTLRRAAGAVLAAALWVAIQTSGQIMVADLFRVRTYAEQVYTAIVGTGEVISAAREVLPGVVTTVLLVVLGLAVCAALMPAARPVSLRQPRRWRLGWWRWPAFVLVALLVVLLLGVPVGNLFYQAGFTGVQVDGRFVPDFSTARALATIAASPVEQADKFLVTGLLSATAGLAAAVVATMLACWARGGRWPSKGWRAGMVALLTALALAVPAPLLGLGLIWCFNRPWLWVIYDTPGAAWLALFLRALPLPVLVMWHAVHSIPQEALEAAEVAGAGFWGRMFRVVLPGCAPAAVAAAVLGMVIAVGEFSASKIPMPPGWQTLSMHLVDLLHSGSDDEVAGIALVMLAMLTATAAGLAVLLGVWRRRV